MATKSPRVAPNASKTHGVSRKTQADPAAQPAAIIATIKPGQLVYLEGLDWIETTERAARNQYFNVPRPATVERVTAKTVFVKTHCSRYRLTGVQLSHGYWFATFEDYKEYHEPQIKKQIDRLQRELAALESFKQPKHNLQLVG